MGDRPASKFQPDLERLEAKRTMSASATPAHVAHAANAVAPATDSVAAAAAHPTPAAAGGAANAPVSAAAVERKPNFGYLVYRITNPTPYNNRLTPIVRNVAVQGIQPVPGQTYNILFVSVRNGTRQTFTATNSQFLVRLPPALRSFPILTGDQVWRPGEIFVFYILSKKYYPLPSQVHSGFQFSLDGARSIGIPGPSGIFQRIKYNPATFDQVLDNVVKYGMGNQGGIGVHFGLPNTSVYEFVNSKTNRNDFSGYF